MTLAVLGGSGFIGSSIVAHCRAVGTPVAWVTAPRVSAPPGRAGEAAVSWRRSNEEAFERLCRALEPFDVVVNAAGLATPAAAPSPILFGANAVLPAVVAAAAGVAGARRLVHVSTAAVQGRLDPLDETGGRFPLSPYAASKADGERAVLDGTGSGDRPPEVVAYRPTSVHAAGRAVTRRLAATLARLPLVPIAGGARPVPVVLVQNVAAGIAFAARMPAPPPVVLQPWEGMTNRRLLELFGARRILSLPRRPAEAVVDVAARSVTSPPLVARLRRVELVLVGQGVRAEALAAAGFRPPVGEEGWEDLSRAQRTAAADPGSGVPAAGANA